MLYPIELRALERRSSLDGPARRPRQAGWWRQITCSRPITARYIHPGAILFVRYDFHGDRNYTIARLNSRWACLRRSRYVDRGEARGRRPCWARTVRRHAPWSSTRAPSSLPSRYRRASDRAAPPRGTALRTCSARRVVERTAFPGVERAPGSSSSKSSCSTEGSRARDLVVRAEVTDRGTCGRSACQG